MILDGGGQSLPMLLGRLLVLRITPSLHRSKEESRGVSVYISLYDPTFNTLLSLSTIAAATPPYSLYRCKNRRPPPIVSPDGYKGRYLVTYGHSTALVTARATSSTTTVFPIRKFERCTLDAMGLIIPLKRDLSWHHTNICSCIPRNIIER